MKHVKLYEDYSDNGMVYPSQHNEKPLITKLEEDTEFMDKIKDGIRYAMDKYNVDANKVWDALGTYIKNHG